MATTDDLTKRLDRLKLAHNDVTEAQAARDLITDENSEEFKKVTDRLTEAKDALTSATLSIVTVPNPIESDKPPKTGDLSKANDSSDLRMDHPAMATSSTRYTAKINQLKEYRYGQNFTIWGKRFRRYLKYTKTPQQDALDMLLSNVDDKTTELLESVEAKMTDGQRSDPDLFIPLLEQAIYPAGEIRGLRAELLGGELIQKDDEKIDDFASRVRSLGHRAYHNADDRDEPCLHAFLRGIRDEALYNMVIAAPGTDESFETAVIEARKFEKLRRKRQTDDKQTDNATHLVYRKYGRQSPSEHNSSEPRVQRNHTTPQRSSTHENDSQIQGPRDSGNTGHRNTNNGHGARRPRRPLSEVQCYRCDVFGHYAANCPQRQTVNRIGAGSSGPRNL